MFSSHIGGMERFAHYYQSLLLLLADHHLRTFWGMSSTATRRVASWVGFPLGARMYVVASQFYRNHFISEKYKRVRSFTLYFLQSSPLVSDNKGVGRKAGCHFVEGHPFSWIRNDVSSTTKAPSLQCWCHSRERVKTSWSHVGGVWGMLQCCHIALSWKILNQNRPVCWNTVKDGWFSIFGLISF